MVEHNHRPPHLAVSNGKPGQPQQPPKTYFKTAQDQELIRTSLLKSSFFSCMDDEQLNTFIQSVELKEYQPGQIIILEGCMDSSDIHIDGENSQVTSSVSTTQHSRRQSSESAASFNEQLHQDNDRCTIDDDTLVEVIDEAFPAASSNDHNDSVTSTQDREKLDENVSISESSTELEHVNSNFPPDQNVENGRNASSVDPTKRQINDLLNNDDTRKMMVGQNMAITNLESTLMTSPIPAYSTLTYIVKPPIPPQSGIPRSIYIIRKGHAQVYYQNPNGNNSKQPYQNSYPVNTLGPGTIFGEGGFLFGRQHSASVIAANITEVNHQNHEPMECWVMDIRTFRDHVLPSSSMRQTFSKFARVPEDESDAEPYMTMDDFLEAINEYQLIDGNASSSYFTLATTLHDSLIRLRLIKTFDNHNIVSAQQQEPKIYLNDFCFLFLLIARPDPEVDIAFLLMDEHQTGQIGLHDLEGFLQPIFPNLDFQSQFFQRYFGVDGNQRIRSTSFSQFLVDLQREIGQQAYIQAVQQSSRELGTATGGYLSPGDFVNILTTSCGWRLPLGIVSRLKEVYCLNEAAKVTGTIDDSTSKHDLRQGELENEAVSREGRQTNDFDHSNAVENGHTRGEQCFSYGDFLAFQEVLGNLPFICNLITRVQELKDGPITADDFKVTNRAFGLGGRVSRRQVEIIFHLFDLDHDGFISRDDVVAVCGTNFTRHLTSVNGRGDRLLIESPPESKMSESQNPNDNQSDLIQKLSTALFNFGIAMIVGGASVGVLHPIELVKTRLMNQRFGHTLRYSGPFDCIQKVILKEGWISLFRGVQSQLLGVAMERSIKLQVHHLLQQAYHVKDEEKEDSIGRKPSLWFEALAGGCAGASQLLVTNPMEITSIRLQMQGETAQLLLQKGIVPPVPSNLWGVVKDLGFPGVYRGASACLLRDIPFSAIYFPAYVACKEALVNNATPFYGKPSPSDVLLAGTLAGIPAALLTTPADVVKCRLQSIARPGETTYTSIQDCATKIYQQEGIKAFFQGASMRVLRIAPQFGLSLLFYESLVSCMGFEKESHPPTNLPIDPQDYLVAFPRQSDRVGLFQRWFHYQEGA